MSAHPRSVPDLDLLDDAALTSLAHASLAGSTDRAARETASRCVGLLAARHRELVRGVIATKVPAVYVDDVESTVFARFAAAVYSGRPVHNPAGLLVKIAKFARADYHDRRRSDTTPLEDWDDAQLDPELEQMATDAAVEELLAPLSERQREAVCRRLLDDETSAEVASRLHTTPGNIDVIVHRALHKLREAAT